MLCAYVHCETSVNDYVRDSREGGENSCVNEAVTGRIPKLRRGCPEKENMQRFQHAEKKQTRLLFFKARILLPLMGSKAIKHPNNARKVLGARRDFVEAGKGRRGKKKGFHIPKRPIVSKPDNPLLASHQGVPGSIPGRATPGVSQVRIVPDDAAHRREISRFPRPYIPVMLHSYLIGLLESRCCQEPPKYLNSTVRENQASIIISCAGESNSSRKLRERVWGTPASCTDCTACAPRTGRPNTGGGGEKGSPPHQGLGQLVVPATTRSENVGLTRTENNDPSHRLRTALYALCIAPLHITSISKCHTASAWDDLLQISTPKTIEKFNPPRIWSLCRKWCTSLANSKELGQRRIGKNEGEKAESKLRAVETFGTRGGGGVRYYDLPQGDELHSMQLTGTRPGARERERHVEYHFPCIPRSPQRFYNCLAPPLFHETEDFGGSNYGVEHPRTPRRVPNVLIYEKNTTHFRQGLFECLQGDVHIGNTIFEYPKKAENAKALYLKILIGTRRGDENTARKFRALRLVAMTHSIREAVSPLSLLLLSASNAEKKNSRYRDSSRVRQKNGGTTRLLRKCAHLHATYQRSRHVILLPVTYLFCSITVRRKNTRVPCKDDTTNIAKLFTFTCKHKCGLRCVSAESLIEALINGKSVLQFSTLRVGTTRELMRMSRSPLAHQCF
ncbi:hypothetical protein PR048_026056 [Dryococelus australis]|uniref:Uncharacterized protein n=1 Tax=Dryococelus australis TaxID=614101 RepID=A0ABQ9GKB8_9NEOP|nr:hypothetical protein PR048_026056 [Dryococelus australis]